MRPFLSSLSLLPLLAACVGDVGEGKVAAEVAEPPPAEKQAPVAGNKLAIDTARSSVKALGAKVTATHPIVFHTWEGSVMVDGDTVTDLAFTVDMSSLEADHPKLTAHLKKEDFFDVARFPTSSFDAAKITAGSNAEGMSHTVEGDLTIRGVTKRVSFPAKIDAAGTEVTASTEFTINRQDFAVTYPGRPDDLVQDNVVLTISLTAPKAG